MTSVGSIVGGAFRLVRQHPVSVLIWGLVYFAAVVGLTFALRPMLAMQVELLSGKEQNPQLLVANMQRTMGSLLLAELVFFVLAIMLFTAALRAVLRPDERGFAFLRLGMDELRLVGLGIFLAFAFYFAFFICMFVMLLVAVLVGFVSRSASVGIAVGLAEFAFVLCATIYLEIRLSLAFPLTVMRRQIVVGESWRLTRGRFWTLFGGYFVVGLIYCLLAAAFGLITLGPYLSELTQNGISPESLRGAAQHQMERQLTIDAMTVVTWILGATIGGLGIALFGGAMATAARDLAGDAQIASDRPG